MFLLLPLFYFCKVFLKEPWQATVCFILFGVYSESNVHLTIFRVC